MAWRKWHYIGQSAERDLLRTSRTRHSGATKLRIASFQATKGLSNINGGCSSAPDDRGWQSRTSEPPLGFPARTARRSRPVHKAVPRSGAAAAALCVAHRDHRAIAKVRPYGHGRRHRLSAGAVQAHDGYINAAVRRELHGADQGGVCAHRAGGVVRCG